LYRLALLLGCEKLLSAAFIGLFAFLFSHFDIVSWTAHSSLILGFCAFLLGFITHIKFLHTGKRFFLFLVGILFVLGMLCYEAFLLWPLSLIFLSHIDSINNTKSLAKSAAIRLFISVVLSVYVFYIIVFFLTRSISTYEDSWVQTRALFAELISVRLVLKTIFAVCFNILHNNCWVNIMPIVITPWVAPESSNVMMGGYLMDHPPTMIHMIIATIILVFIVAFIVVYLRRYKHFHVLKIFLLFLFLLFSFTFVLFHCKYFSNKIYFYNFQQFRYQYIPNAFFTLIALLLCDHVSRLRKKRNKFIYLILSLLLVLNIYQTRRFISLETHQMAPLNRLLTNIKMGIRSGQINREHKLYLHDDIVDVLPPMCWNPYMGKVFMERTYQWLFNKEEIQYFSDTEQDAAWVIDKSKISLIKK
jgi:hypothetical protein